MRIGWVPVAMAGAMVWTIALARPAAAERIEMVGTFPALARELAHERSLAIGRFAGEDGEPLARAIAARLHADDAGAPPHYLVVPIGEAADAVLEGDVATDVDHRDYTTERSRCAEKQDGKCVRRDHYRVACVTRTVTMQAELRAIRVADRRPVYAVTKPRSDATSWCEDEGAPRDTDAVLDAMIASIADEVRTDVAPHTDRYGIRIRENRDGMERGLADRFKAAVKLTNHDAIGSCNAFRGMAAQMPEHPSLAFNVALCDEAAGDYTGAATRYAQARLLTAKGGGDIDLGIERTRGLMVAQRDAATPRR